MLYEVRMKGRDAEQFEDLGFGETSRYAAHLDRGWAMLERGDPAAARSSAEHAQEARPDDPDAVVLLGAVALAEGDAEESLRSYDRAVELDPEYLEPYTAAAQVCLFELDDPNRGLRYCLDALELDTLGPFERLDVHLVAAECEIAGQLDADAQRRVASLDEESVLMSTLRLSVRPDLLEEVDRDDPQSVEAVAWAYLCLDPEGDELDEEERTERVARALGLAFRLARTRLDLGDVETTTETLDELLRWYPGEADAWYLASEAHHRAGRLPEACVSAVKTLELDHELELPEWVPSFTLVHRRVVQLLKDSPEPALEALVDTGHPVTVMVRDTPAPELVMEGVDPRAPVLALAARPIPLTEAEAKQDPGPPQLTGMAVYRRNLARFARNAEHFEQELRHTVLDELAAFVGLGDSARERLGLPSLGLDEDDPMAPPVPEEPDDGSSKRKRGRRRRSRALN